MNEHTNVNAEELVSLELDGLMVEALEQRLELADAIACGCYCCCRCWEQ